MFTSWYLVHLILDRKPDATNCHLMTLCLKGFPKMIKRSSIKPLAKWNYRLLIRKVFFAATWKNFDAPWSNLKFLTRLGQKFKVWPRHEKPPFSLEKIKLKFFKLSAKHWKENLKICVAVRSFQLSKIYILSNNNFCERQSHKNRFD